MSISVIITDIDNCEFIAKDEIDNNENLNNTVHMISIMQASMERISNLSRNYPIK